MKVIVALTDMHSGRSDRYAMVPGAPVRLVRWQSDYLVSAGQSVDFGMTVAVVYDPEPRMPDASQWSQIVVEPQSAGYWAYDLPSTRPVAEIMKEAVAHGRNTTHGIDCVCMDNLIRELYAQVVTALPAKTEEVYNDREKWEDWNKGFNRVRYLLHAVYRKL